MKPEEYQRMYDAEDHHWWYVALHELILQYIGIERERLSCLTIYDAGCGTGRLLQLMSRYGIVLGCDASAIALKHCMARGLRTALAADLNTDELGSDRYDIVTSIDLLCQTRIKDDQLVVKKFFAALKPGGLLVLQVPAYGWLCGSHDVAVSASRRYIRPSLEAILKETGFHIERSSYRVSLLFIPIVLVRFVNTLLRNPAGRINVRSDVRKHSRLVNGILLSMMRIENILLKRVSFPFGSSLLVLGRKPEAPASALCGINCRGMND